jgi:hypothetical protein
VFSSHKLFDLLQPSPETATDQMPGSNAGRQKLPVSRFRVARKNIHSEKYYVRNGYIVSIAKSSE